VRRREPRPPVLRRLFPSGEPATPGHTLRRIEEKQRSLTAATEKWLSLLREMEHAGQSGDAQYEAYYQAYLQAKQQQKRVDLELFNLRNGLTT
jgi:hypothetical protein